MSKFILVHTFENYRDFEPDDVEHIDGIRRVTLDDDTLTGYLTYMDGGELDINWTQAGYFVDVTQR